MMVVGYLKSQGKKVAQRQINPGTGLIVMIITI